MKSEYTTEEKELIKLFRKGKLPLASFITSHLFNAVTIDDVWQVTPHGIKIDGVIVSKETLHGVSQEAQKFLEGQLWRQVKRSLQLSANTRMYHKATNIDEIIFGKSMLYCTELMETFIGKISKI